MRVAVKEKKAPRAKLCRVESCRKSFIPQRMGQSVCSTACALKDVKRNQEKAKKSLRQAERKAHQERKEKLKSRADYAKDCQQAFNEWVRLRDSALPCVSCGRHHDGQYHAGHYRTVSASPELRFEPLNVHKQCAPCNNHKSGDIVNYRIELVKRIGIEAVEWIEGPHEPKRYTIEDLKAITAEYRLKTRQFKAEKET